MSNNPCSLIQDIGNVRHHAHVTDGAQEAIASQKLWNSAQVTLGTECRANGAHNAPPATRHFQMLDYNINPQARWF